MQPFLSLVAKDLINKFGDDIQNITTIFPSHRTSVFFNKYLSEIIDKPVWQPKSMNISEMMFNTAQMNTADPILLCYELYKEYIKTINKDETFDDFYFWGKVMISDFDQIDKYLVDSKNIFANIKDLKEIDRRFDEFGKEQQQALENFLNIMDDSIGSQIRSRYSEIWDKLGSLYSSFTASLVEKRIGYDGLAYRIAANKLRQAQAPIFGGKFAVVGFNALNKCEKILLQHLKTYNNAIFYWDYDSYYMQSDSSKNEAALFMHDNLKQFPNELGNEHFNNLTDKNINIISAPSNIAQAKLIPKIISQISPKNGKLGMNTAIILPEEQLLLPVLSAIPNEIEQVNITMAYPIRNTSAYSLVEFLLGLQINAKSSDASLKFYYKDVLNILGHPYIKQIVDNTDKLIKHITSHKFITVDAQLFNQEKLLSKIFIKVDDTKQTNLYINAIICEVAATINNDTLNESNNRLELEFLFTIYKALNRLESIITLIGANFTLKTYRAILRSAIAQERVSFIGEPLSGLQVIGFLESRNLDFENLIILSLNDSILPGSNIQPSFVTPSLRTAFGLPDNRHKNAIYAYYFYRVIQRAKNITLTYSNVSEGMKTGEMSRYILQLMLESKLKINQIEVNFELGQNNEPEIRVKKTERVLALLNKYVKGSASNKFLSPTALSNYTSCSLRFFFSKIANFEAPEDMDEIVDSRGIGTILHRSIELIYSTISGEITQEKIFGLLHNKDLIDKNINTALAEWLDCKTDKIDEFLAGRNKLILEQVKWMVEQALKVDLDRTPYSIVSHEEKLETSIPITVNNEVIMVKIGGFADRIEAIGNMFRIVDFKTGKYLENKIKFEKINELFTDENLKGIFQLFVYSEIFAQQKQVEPNRIAQNLWFVRKEQKPEIFIKIEKSRERIKVESFEPFREEFNERLTDLIAEIFNPEIDFTQNPKGCKQCPYCNICGK